ncbi:MAG: PAS domain S-box protein [Chloroflexi bacterium]|nr:PAS domain S-box protein [Chloroflexota bacterium]
MALERLTRPSSALTDQSARQQARLLAVLALTFIVIVPIIVLMWVVPGSTYMVFRPVSPGILLTAVLIYSLSRTRHYCYGAMLMVLTIFSLVTLALLTLPGSLTERMPALNFLTAAIMVSSLFLRQSVTWVVTLLSLGITSAFFFLPDVPFIFIYIYLASFLSVTILGAVGAVLTRRYKEQLLTSEERYRSVVMAMSEGVVLQSRDGLILACNAAAECILGLTTAQMMGRASVDSHLQAIREDGTPCPPDEHPAMVTLRTGRPLTNVIMGIQRPTGERRWISINSQPLTRPDESLPFAVVTSFTDFTGRLQQEQDLIDSRSRYYALFEQGHDAVFILDLEGHHLEANHRAANMLGYSMEEMQELTYRDLSAEIDESEDVRQKLLAGEHIPVFERTFRRKDGRHIPVEIKVELVRSLSGQPLHIQSVARDITELCQTRRELKRLQKRLEFAISAARLAWWEMDGDTGQVQFDKRRVLMAGYQPQAFQNVTYHAFTDLIHPDDYAATMQAMQDVLSGQQPFYAAIYRMRTADGGWMWLRDWGELLTNESERRIVRGYVIDISESKEAQQREIDLALEKERVQMLSTFIQSAAHEFRTPLAIINTTAFVMAHINEMEKRQQKVSIIQGQVQRIVRLIDMLLLLTRLESSAPTLQPAVDINAVMESFCQQVVANSNCRLTIRCEESARLPLVAGNPDELLEAIQQIVDNACRFTPADGVVTISSGATDASVWIELRDTGPGIAPENLPHLFETFWRLDEAHSTPGFGLGLAIARKVMERHGGRIEVKSEVGAGSAFQLILPTQSQSAVS